MFVSDHCREPSRGRVSKDKGKRIKDKLQLRIFRFGFRVYDDANEYTFQFARFFFHALYLRSQIATSRGDFFRCQLEHKILWKPSSITPDLLVESLGRHTVQSREMNIDQDFMTTN